MKKMLASLLVLCLMAVPGAKRGGHKCPRRIRHPFCRVHRHVRHVRSRRRQVYRLYNEPQSKKRLSPVPPSKFTTRSSAWKPAYWTREDVYTLFKWNGTQYSFPYWNHDHALASATRESVVSGSSPRIGPERMQEYIDKIGYGNKDISGGLTTFWLGSSLQISALEQVDLLNKLYSGQLPFSAANTAILQKNITLSEDGGTKLMGKTGSALRNEKWVSGWFVGCVNRTAGIFATNIEAADGANGGKAGR